jgi:2-C-methyl-D-erythritol 2,4-cyclodiphosphate synthase
MKSSIRIGIGYDVHCLVENRQLILGGVHIPYSRGLQGHSDADVLLHAISDAVLGAAGLGDIGRHFPDTDPAWQGVDSRRILETVCELAREKGYGCVNVDAVVVAQKPKLAPYMGDMRINVAECLGIPVEDVNIKATTTEGLGLEGRSEGISAQAVVLLMKHDSAGSQQA